MPIYSRYILAQTLRPLLLAVAISLLLLLIERMMRLLELVLNSQGTVDVLFQLLAFLVPHYMGLALPAAFFLGMLLAFSRLRTDSELDALGSAGLGLHHLIRPALLLALLLTLVSALVFSHLQPHARYTYRSLVHQLANGPLNNYLQNGMFITAGETTYMAESIDPERRFFLKVFAYRDSPKEGISAITAAQGHLIEGKNQAEARLVLRNGHGLEIRPGVQPTGRASAIDFEEIQRRVTLSEPKAFRARGIDERELTLPELWQAWRAGRPGLSRDVIRAEWHDRIIRIVSILLLPVLAVPLSVGGARRGRSNGMAVGLILLLVYNKLIGTGESLAASGDLPSLVAQWGVFAVFAAVSGFVFLRGAFRPGGSDYGILAFDAGAALAQTRRFFTGKEKPAPS